MQASYHSPLEGESQKPSRQAKADAVGGGRRAAKLHPPATYCFGSGSRQRTISK